jgi:YVTN family beta-propeller protein
MKTAFITFCIYSLLVTSCSAQNKNIKLVQTFHIASAGGWDYLAVNSNKLYVSHGLQVNILDKSSGDSIGVIAHTDGVHGIAFVNSINKGFTSNGRLNNVSVFDLATDSVTSQISTGKNPDAILYDHFSKNIYTCNGGSNDVTVIDPVTKKVIATIPVGGKPETAVSNGKGTLYVNIEDKNEVVKINTTTYKVENHWTLKTGEGPTGLAFDSISNRLFSACDNNLLIVLDAASGKVVAKVPIGEGCDGDVFDPASKTIYTSNGEGTMTVINEVGADNYKVAETVKTKRGARTITMDYATKLIYLPTADFEEKKPTDPENQRPKMIAGTFQVLVYQN